MPKGSDVTGVPEPIEPFAAPRLDRTLTIHHIFPTHQLTGLSINTRGSRSRTLAVDSRL